MRELVCSNSKAFQPKMAGGWEKGRGRDAALEKKNMDKIVWELDAQKQQDRELHQQQKHPREPHCSHHISTALVLPPIQASGHLSHATNIDQWPPGQPLREKLQNLQVCKRSKHQVSSVKKPMNSAVQCRYFQQIIFSCLLSITEPQI